MTSNSNNYPYASTTDYTYHNLPPTSLSPSIDYRRIGRCMNLESMLDHWLEKHRLILDVDANGVHIVYEVPEGKETWHREQLADFPIYELALQYALDAITARLSAVEELARTTGVQLANAQGQIARLETKIAIDAHNAEALMDLQKKRDEEFKGVKI